MKIVYKDGGILTGREAQFMGDGFFVDECYEVSLAEIDRIVDDDVSTEDDEY